MSFRVVADRDLSVLLGEKMQLSAAAWRFATSAVCCVTAAEAAVTHAFI